METEDGDFIDYDMTPQSSENLVIISHGLEGNSERPYVVGMMRELIRRDFDVVAWNFRSCSAEMNRKLIMYHSGATYDLRALINEVSGNYSNIFLIGFSLGGNLTLKFLGEGNLDKKVKGGTAICAPLDLLSGSLNLSKGWNRLYEMRFLRSLKKKIKVKHSQFPDKIDLDELERIQTLYEMDDKFTAPIHGFRDAQDYYDKCSSSQFIHTITVPTLILNPLNDPLLTEKSLNPRMIPENKLVTIETPDQGGHCGFPERNSTSNWGEKYASAYLERLI